MLSVTSTHSAADSDREGSASGSSEAGGTKHPMLGGEIDTHAYCLLEGMLDENKRVSFPITTLPVILGRTHISDGNDASNGLASSSPPANFIPMGKLKALSRQHLKIEYRTKMGTFTVVDGEFVYKPERMKKPPTERGPGGFYVVTCLGKNSIRVDGETIKNGEQAVLDSQSTIKVGNFRLYFLLPEEESTATVQIPMQKRKVISSGPISPISNKKPALAVSGKAAAGPVAASASGATSTTTSTQGAWTALQAEIDATPTDELLRQLTEAVESDTWERRHQLIGSTLSYRAVLEAAQDPHILNLARKNGGAGVSRHDLMNWIATSSRFSDWVRLMLHKLEDKSYQASITKALIKANFVRTASSGRYIKWLLPSDVDQGVPKGDASPPAEKNEAESPLGGEDKDESSEDERDGSDGNDESNDEADDDGGEGDNEEEDDQPTAGQGEGDEENDEESDQGDASE